jgi:hypothetical protein
MRNEKILQLIAYYFSIDGNILDLNEKLTSMNYKIDELFAYSVISNTYMILYDKNLTPSQMVNNFTNFDKEKYNERKVKENEIFNFKKYIQQLNKQKEEIHNKFISYCKDKYEVKNKYFLNNNEFPKYQNGNDNDNNMNNILKMNKNNNMDIEEDRKDKEDINDKKEKSDDSIEDDNIINGIINKNKNKRNNIENGYESKTRKKNKILYFNHKYNDRKSAKKIIRKNKSLVLRNTGKYYLNKK